MWERIKQSFRTFMTGRYGSDQLNNVLIWTGLILLVLDMLLGVSLLGLLGLAAYGFSLFRMFSRNVDQRRDENRRFMGMVGRLSKQFNQAKSRFAHRKEYKYFRCPQCRSWIRLPRNTGEVTVTCKHCQTAFEQKA